MRRYTRLRAVLKSYRAYGHGTACGCPLYTLPMRSLGRFTFSSVATLTGLLALGSVSSCSSEGEGSSIGDGTPNESQAQAGSGNAGSGNGAGGNEEMLGGGSTLGPAVEADAPIPEDQICVHSSTSAAASPVDLYIMLDQSTSMAEMTSSGGTRWDAVTGAIASFVADPRAAGIGVGIDYFGIGFDPDANCEAANYADPDVGIATLPGNRDALVASLDGALGPQSASLTPTYAALDGALQYAAAHAAQLQDEGSDRLTFVLLATDGFPTQCDTSPASISGLAASAFAADPAVRTYAIALSEGESNVRAIAEAGGGQAFIIEDDEDVTQRFLDTMLSITLSHIECSHDIDVGTGVDGGQLVIDHKRANVTFTPTSTGQAVVLPRRDNLLECQGDAGEGFYFDPPEKPTRIVLCPKSCTSLGAGEFSYNLACLDTGIGPIQ